YDHRGNGRSGRPPVDTLTMEQLADDAAALLDHLGAAHARVIGHSYGGFIGQEFALRHPDRLEALVLVDTTPGQLGDGEVEDTRGVQPPPEFLALMSTPPASDAELAARIPDMLPFYFHRAEKVDIAGHMANTVFSVDAMMQSMMVLGGWSSVDRLKQVAVPTLVLFGRHDVITSWPQGERIASRIPGAQLQIFEESGHFPWLEQHDAFFELLTGWLHDLG
ncbi:MAG: alpha/beta fold hydrolase, partial [Actinobacteria bacterium]|nr:alpha/beta fold hydrolase [Actinomycetota bacterium]